jgi:ubiquinol-cytochrome c reductase iron-sulfur subunit
MPGCGAHDKLAPSFGELFADPAAQFAKDAWQSGKSASISPASSAGFPVVHRDVRRARGGGRAQRFSRMAASEYVDNPNQHPPMSGGGEDETGVRRRDFLNVAAVSFAGVGAVAVVVPLVNQMNPSADVLALAAIEVDISKVVEGSGIKVSWRKQPVFVRHLTAKEIAEANAVPLSSLRDPQTLAERTKPGHENWLITMAVCTHLGCVPLGITPEESRGDFGGYFCPCHGSQYDTAARIRKGPAPLNLQVPEYAFKSSTVVQIG